MKQVFIIVFVIFSIISLIAIAFTLNQVNQETTRLENDLRNRSSLLTNGLRETVEPNFINKSDQYLQSLVEKYADNKRVAGLAIVDNKGAIVAVSSSLPKEMSQPQEVATNAMDADQEEGIFSTFNGEKMYVFATPLHNNEQVVGSLLVVQNASYIDEYLLGIWTRNVLRIITQGLLLSISILLILRWIIYKPIQLLAESLQKNRYTNNNDSNVSSNPLFEPLLKEVSHMQESLIQARLEASEEAKASLDKLNSPWTSQRLQEFIKDIAKDRPIYLVSNREPYIHTKNGTKISYSSPASGVISALEPVMESCGGMWIAAGSGNADKETVDANDTIAVPPRDPKYTLKRVWLTKTEEEGYYNGFSNEGLWPLCHQAYTRPIFRKDNWEEYIAVNKKFATTILSEMKNTTRPIVFIQDFHLALVPRMIKEKRPDATIGIFWHIPWPSQESFGICPWKKDLLDGILGADIVGFHTQLHSNNFIATVRREIESLVDLERFTVTRKHHVSLIKNFPISIEFPSQDTDLKEAEKAKILKNFDINTPFIGLGVDRLDYTKGILERFKAIEIFLRKYPAYQGKFTFLQISVPSRTDVKRYQAFRKEVEIEAERINTLYKKNGWRPIVLSLRHYTHDQLSKFYKLANFCLITSLDDGMNLVAKEFVSSRNDEKGVLLLSEFTGASRQLTNALLVNPYNGEDTAENIKVALEMSLTEQTRRMRIMREEVKTHNIYLWSAEIIKALVSLA